MKLGNPWVALQKNIEKMEGDVPEFNLGFEDEQRINVSWDALRKGIEITLENLDDPSKRGGLLSVDGHQVLLYIPDQGHGIDKVLADPLAGRRVHIADCKTLETMRVKQRFHERYIATNDISDTFLIFGKSKSSAGSLTNIDGFAQLKVCKNCLGRINYKGYKKGSQSSAEIFRNFNLAEFFSEYSSVFRELPSRHNDDILGRVTDVSELEQRDHIQNCGSTCEKCSVDLGYHGALFKVIRQKPQGALSLLCMDCVRKPPNPYYVHVPQATMIKITAQRRLQTLINNSWEETKRFADPACLGLLEGYQQIDWAMPVVGYDISDSDGGVITAVELAWPDINPPQAVYLDEESGLKAKEHGWDVYSLDEALQELNQD